MSTCEFRRRVALRNSIHPRRGAKDAGFLFALALVIAGCKSEDSPAANPDPAPPAKSQTVRVQQPAMPPMTPSPAPAAPADVATPPADGEKTPDGLVMKVITPGSGAERVKPGTVFVISFTSWDRAGKVQSHFEHAEINMNSLAPGWAEAIVLMAPGETRRLWMPASLTRKPNVPDPRPVVDITVDLQLEYIGRLRMQGHGAPVVQASAPSEPASNAAAASASAAPAASAKGHKASAAAAAPKKH